MAEIAQLLVTGVAVGCIYGLVALGFVLIYKAGEVVNFAQGDLMMLGALLAVTFVSTMGLGYWTGFGLAVVAMLFIGGAIDAVIVRRIVGYPQFSTVMLTLGIGFILRSVAAIAWGPETRTLQTPFSAGMLHVGEISISYTYASIIVGTLALCVLMYLAFRYTKVGQAMQAASENQLAAYYMGIPVRRYLSLIWAVSAAVSACAGVLLAPVTLVDVNMGSIGLKAFAAAVIGGFGSIPGALVGGIIIGVVELLAGVALSAAWRDTSPYIVLLAVLLARPHGIFGKVVRKKV
ncbi:branched-chain amino acid ABC transporter permease [Variovorax sp. VNK109]|uniref:branched-chain amino acid ABC transporter permease n=1 Tax=Variovorax sp. VNK109 TaxID=3400919 RepID=UPI003C088682